VSSGGENTTAAEVPAVDVDRSERAEPRRTAVLDSAHLGDIEGAFGRISVG